MIMHLKKDITEVMFNQLTHSKMFVHMRVVSHTIPSQNLFHTVLTVTHTLTDLFSEDLDLNSEVASNLNAYVTSQTYIYITICHAMPLFKHRLLRLK